MSLPGLGRLALCPTGGTNDAEAGSSRSVAGPHQHHALDQADIVMAIVLSLVGDDPEEACRAAAGWCNLNTDHQKACKGGGYALLTETIFPGAQPKPPGVTQEDWFFHMCHEHQHARKVKEYNDSVAECDGERAAALTHEQTDPEARKLFDRMRIENQVIRVGDRCAGLIQNDKENHDAFLARRAARDATHPEEREITALQARAYEVLVRTTTPEYRNTPLRKQYAPYIVRIQLFRFEIFVRRYQGDNLDTNRRYFVRLARGLKVNLDKLEQVMEHSKEEAEARGRMMQE